MRRSAPFAWMLAITLTLALFTQHRSAWAGGTHFVVQLHGGFAFPPTGGSDLSLGWGFLAGYGGRLGGTHLRFYGLVGFDRASFAEEGVVPETGHPWSSQRSYNDLQAGLRMLLPIWWRLRWYVDLFVGASYLQGELMWTSTFPFDTSDWSGLLTGATGLEVRWHRHFATGIRGEIRWLMTESDVIPQIVGQEEASPLRFTVMATQAFLF